MRTEANQHCRGVAIHHPVSPTSAETKVVVIHDPLTVAHVSTRTGMIFRS